MPRKYARKRNRRGKRPYRRKNNQMVIKKSPMPLRFATKLRYVENVQINPPAAGLCGTYVFNAGGVYDPNTTGTGHQPRGFDQIMAMYDHCVVIGSTCTATLTHNSSATINEICGIALRDGATVDTDPNDYQEGGTVRTQHLTTYHPTKTLRLGYSPKKFLGISHPLSYATLKNGATSNPSESAYFHIFSAGLGSTDPSAIDVTIQIDYLCVFMEPKDVAQS